MRRYPRPIPDPDLEAALAVLELYDRRAVEILDHMKGSDPSVLLPVGPCSLHWASLGAVHLLNRARDSEMSEPLHR